jgi:hypothetical protein
VVLQQRWAGIGARFHVQDLWLYEAATVVVVLLFAGVIDRFEVLGFTVCRASPRRSCSPRCGE